MDRSKIVQTVPDGTKEPAMLKKIAGMLASGIITTVVKGLALNTVAAAVNHTEALAKRVVSPDFDEFLPVTSGEKRVAAIDFVMERVDIPVLSKKTERKLWGVVIDMMVEVFKHFVWNTPA